MKSSDPVLPSRKTVSKMTVGQLSAEAAKQKRSAKAPMGKGKLVAQVMSGQGHWEDREPSAGDLIEAIHAGLPFQELEVLQASFDVPMEKLAPQLGMSIATLHRRKQQGRLAPSESDRVVRFARLMGKAVGVFGNEEDARRWLVSGQVGLGGVIPLEYAATEVGAREVENLLGRIEHGIFS